MNDTGFIFEDFPEELQIYILSRLPPKALSRCKCVSEHWNTTLTIQAFLLRNSLSYDKHSKLAFVLHSTRQGYESVLSFEFSNNNTPNTPTMTVPKTIKMSVIIRNNSGTTEISTEEVIIGNHECFCNSVWYREGRLMSNICNGLICVFDWCSPRVGLFNLKTQDFIQLPVLTTKSARCCRYWYALGFDPVCKVYKVLSIYGGTKECRTKAAIFTLGSNHWKPIEYEVVRPAVTMSWRYWRLKNMFCLDGVIYRVNDNEILGDIVLTVVAFDLNSEVFREYKLVLIPIQDADKTIRCYLTSLKGCPTLFIWKMGSDEIQQLTLFNHKHPKAAWKRRIFTAPDFPKNFPYGSWGNYVAGGSILLKHVKPFKNFAEIQEPFKNSLLSWCKWYDLENFAID